VNGDETAVAVVVVVFGRGESEEAEEKARAAACLRFLFLDCWCVFPVVFFVPVCCSFSTVTVFEINEFIHSIFA
jgi:hypothetical protein